MYDLTPLEKHIYETVLDGGTEGVPIARIVTRAYAANSNGGPDQPENTIKVTKLHLNRKLVPFGLEIRSTLGRGARYTLQKLEQRNVAHR